jgi:hypothetical protein
VVLPVLPYWYFLVLLPLNFIRWMVDIDYRHCKMPKMQFMSSMSMEITYVNGNYVISSMSLDTIFYFLCAIAISFIRQPCGGKR